MIRHLYNHLLPSVQDTKGIEGRTLNNGTTIKSPKAESQKDSFFQNKWSNGIKNIALTRTFMQRHTMTDIVVSVLFLLFVALWFILRGDLFYVLPCVILFLCVSVILALRLPRLGKREQILMLFVRLFDCRLFGFV